MIRKYIDDAVDLVLPRHCGGCQRPGYSVCPGCQNLLREPRRARYIDNFPVWAVNDYAGAVRSMLLSYKEHSRRDLTRPLSAAVARAIIAAVPAQIARGPGPVSIVLVPIPSRRTAARRRGGDHVRRLVQATVPCLNAHDVPAATVSLLSLTRKVRDSVGLSAVQRQINVSGAFGLRDRPPQVSMDSLAGSVVIVDDLITTGATLGAAAATLRAQELRVLAGVVIAVTVRSGQ